MYITDKFICFYSNLFGMEKKIRIPYSHITLITKEKTALVIPNAIAITTYRKEYIFRSFWDRDECFEMLKSFIKKYKGITNSSSSKSTAHSSNTTASTGNSDSNAVANTSHNSQDGENDDSKAVNAPVKKRSSTNASASTVEDNEVEQDDTSTNDDHDIASFDEECKASRLKIVVLGGETIHVPLDVFLTKLVDDQASYSLKA